MKQQVQVKLDKQGRLSYLVQGFVQQQVDGTVKYDRLRISAGETIDELEWDFRSQRPMQTYSARDRYHLHHKLDRHCGWLHQAYVTTDPAQRTTAAVKAAYHQLAGTVKKKTIIPSGKQKKQNNSTLLTDMVDQWVNECKTGTANLYNAFGQKVKDFEAYNHNRKVDLAKFDQTTYEYFIAFCQTKLELNQPALWNVQKHLNKAIRQAKKKGIPTTAFPSSQIKYQAPTKDYLDWGEYKLLIDHKPTSPKMRNTQAIVCLMMFTGIRISDLHNLVDNIKEREGMIVSQFRCTKSPSPEVMPVLPLPTHRFLKQDIRIGSEQHLRKDIKQLMQEVGIDKHIQPHSLRRSWISNLLILGSIPEYLIAKVYTGHQMGKQQSIFQGYNQAGLVKQAKLISKMLHNVDPSETAGIKLI